MEKIVVTDGFTLNPGDLDWKALEQFGSVRIYERTSKTEVIDRCGDASIIVTNKTVIDSKTIAQSPKLKLIAVTATGYNVVDVVAAKNEGVVVVNVPGYGTDSVAQHAFALILELTNHVGINSFMVAKGAWSKNDDWCFTQKPLIELAGKTIGIAGYGSIGAKVAEIANAFGMKVLFYNRSKKVGLGLQVSLEEVFSQSDFVTLHIPSKPDNEKFLNQKLLALMKNTAFLINTARGQLINEDDLATALRRRQIAGAALDVLSQEPPMENHPLIGLDNCLITPHNAWLSFEARQRIFKTTIDNIRFFLQGNPKTIVV